MAAAGDQYLFSYVKRFFNFLRKCRICLNDCILMAQGICRMNLSGKSSKFHQYRCFFLQQDQKICSGGSIGHWSIYLSFNHVLNKKMSTDHSVLSVKVIQTIHTFANPSLCVWRRRWRLERELISLGTVLTRKPFNHPPCRAWKIDRRLSAIISRKTIWYVPR